MDILKILEQEFNIKPQQAQNTVKLIDEGNTIPFIARYRKELTDSLDDQVLRQLYDRLMYLRSLEEKKEQVVRIITEQGNMTEELLKKIEGAETVTEIEDIYRPFRPKRRTKATIARERGLEPLANAILEQRLKDINAYAKGFINADAEVFTEEDALGGAMDIISEMISDDADLRKIIRSDTLKFAAIVSKAKEETAESVYEMYYDYSEGLKTVPPHRVLAMNRGEKEGVLSVKISADTEAITEKMRRRIIKRDSTTADLLAKAIEESYKSKIAPAIEREIRNELTEKAEDKAIGVFSENLKQLLLLAPIKDKVVLALDPAYRTGCKIAVIDATGKALDTAVIYPTPPQNKTEAAKTVLNGLIKKHGVGLIAIGNGTASRESELFISDLIKENGYAISYCMVNEAGASVYSASKLGAEEFPDFDVSLRSAVSIGRRLQDPLAELVKIDPKSIGVGQYQHDMNQKNLSRALGGVVESCVNSVGVDVNTASPSLLSYVSGISGGLSKNILAYRNENGKFKSRSQLLKVSKLGPKAYEQCAGFLRIPESDNPFDNTGVHPESYKAAKRLIEKTGFSLEDIRQGRVKGLLGKIADLERTAQELEIGVPTLTDIIRELEKPGRDPREEMPPQVLRSDVLEMDDLKEGMVLRGTVRNVIDFGAFVDIGVHQDGLVHISQICDRFIKHPLEAVSVGDIVNVKVLGVDKAKNRISLTMKGV